MKFEDLTQQEKETLLEKFIRSSPYIPAAKLVFDHYRMELALNESVKLQSHYAKLLNEYDGGERVGFDSGEAWMNRLDECGKGFKI